jgi:uncharacterized membrane protein YjfL (UPF0719 family)
MNWNVFLFTSFEVLIALIFSLITVFITKVALNKTLLKKDLDGDHKNIAVAIFSGTIILCILLLVNSSILPAVDTLSVMALNGRKLTGQMFLTSFLYFLLFFGISIFFSILLLFATLKVYLYSTRKVDEMEELKNNNTAVAILMSIVFIGITLSVQPSLERFIFSLVDYESSDQIVEPVEDTDHVILPEPGETPH